MKTIPTIILFSMGLMACGENEAVRPVLESESEAHFEYSIIGEGMEGDCPEDGCLDGPPISMCSVASNLGVLAILENVGETKVFGEDRRCGSRIAMYSTNVRVLAHVAGDELPRDIVLYSGGFGDFSREGAVALVQLHEFEGRDRVIRSVDIVRDSFIRDGAPGEYSVDEAQILPNTLSSLREAANRIDQAPEECMDFPRRSEQFWNDLYHGICDEK